MGTILGASYYQIKYCLRNKLRQATGDPDFLYRHYVGKPFYDTDALNTYTAELIKSGRPFMMGRFGAVELFNMRVAEFHMENKKEKACEQLFTCAGFFPNDTSLLPRFNDIMKDACRQTDILGLWQILKRSKRNLPADLFRAMAQQKPMVCCTCRKKGTCCSSV